MIKVCFTYLNGSSFRIQAERLGFCHLTQRNTNKLPGAYLY